MTKLLLLLSTDNKNTSIVYDLRVKGWQAPELAACDNVPNLVFKNFRVRGQWEGEKVIAVPSRTPTKVNPPQAMHRMVHE